MIFGRFLLFLFAIATFFSCNSDQQHDETTENNGNNPAVEAEEKNPLLPFSTGKISTLYLYVDQSFQESELIDTLNYNLVQPYLLTTNMAPALDVTRYSFETFQSGGTRSANNLMVINVGEDSRMSRFVKEQLGQTRVAEVLAGKELALIRVKDVTASPQQIFYLLANGFPNLSSQQVQSAIDQYAQTIVEDVTVLDNKRLISSFSRNRSRAIENKIAENFGFDIWIPETYETVLEEENFLWVINETNDLYSNIVVYSSTYDPEFSLEKQVLAVRDEFGEKITTNRENSRMTTNINQKPYPIQRQITVNNKTVLETRGLWRMVNDRLGGGFVNYSWVQEDEIITIDGFVYFAGNEKRRKMRDIDAIFSTIQRTDTN